MSEQYATLDVVRDAGIATVWMNRPDVHNAFNEELIDELATACAALGADPAVRVVVLAGRGRNFSAGADLKWMQRASAATIADNEQDARRFAAMLRTLAELPRPTIARVQGAALGGGTGLAAACDICVASEDAQFATSEVRFGILPAVISPYVLRAIGPRQAYRYFLSAERIPAARALALGLAHEVVPGGDLDATVGEIARALAANGPGAQAASKELIRAFMNRPIDDALIDDTARRIARQRATDEARAGFAAFLEKRAPPWTIQP